MVLPDQVAGVSLSACAEEVILPDLVGRLDGGGALPPHVAFGLGCGFEAWFSRQRRLPPECDKESSSSSR